jgi:isoleucyl-tRNA synthetase
MRICSIGRAARSQAGIKVRQPLQKLYIALPTLEEKDDLEIITPQILEELNVKKLSVVKDEMDFSTRSVQLNMSSVGPKFGNKLNDLKEALLKEDPEDIFQQTRKCPDKNDSELDPNCKILIGSFELSPGDINFISIDKPSLSVSRDAGYTVAITTAIGSELASEGMARELVHKIQNMRRSAGFDIADQITTYYKCDAQLKDVISAHNDYLRQETLSLELIEGDPPESSYLESHQLDGLSITLAVKR